MNKTIALGIILTIVAVVGFFIFSTSTRKTGSTSPVNKVIKQDNQTPPTSQSVNKQASFAIFTNGTFRVFTATMYHNLSQDVYIEANNPNIVIIKKEGITWNDFFETLPFKLTQDCLTTGTKEIFCTGANGSMQFYLNGSLNQNALDKEINAHDQLLVTFGKEDAQQIQDQVQQLRKIR